MSFQTFANSLPASLSLGGRTALVTGSSSGIGRQTALHLARLGAKILCADLRPEPLEDRPASDPAAPAPAGSALKGSRHIPTHELINRLGGESEFAVVDVSKEEAFKAAVEAAVRLGDGRLDILVNNAGIVSFSGGIAGESLAVYEKTMAVNVRGVYIGTQLAVRQMLTQDPQPLPADLEEDLDALDETEGIDALPRMRAPFAQEEGPPPTVGRLDGDLGGRGSRGVIINIGSIHGLIGGPGEPAYAASKAAVVNLTRQVACEYAPQRINCNVICPGYLDTAMTLNVPPELAAKRPTYWPHRGTARDVANTVVYLARDAPWMTGSVVAIDGGTTAR